MSKYPEPTAKTFEGTKYWVIPGTPRSNEAVPDLFHRLDGPAIIWTNGEQNWFINDIEYDCMEWLLKVHELENE